MKIDLSFPHYDDDPAGPWYFLPDRSIPFRRFIERDVEKLKRGGDHSVGVPRLVEWATRLAAVESFLPEYLNQCAAKRKPGKQPRNLSDFDWLLRLCDEENYRYGPEILAHCLSIERVWKARRASLELERVNAPDTSN